jgi:c-di-AMP phosphodiesterase-like protein
MVGAFVPELKRGCKVGDKLIKTITGPFIRLLIASILILTMVVFCFDWWVGAFVLAIGLVFIIFAFIVRVMLRKWTNAVLEEAVVAVGESTAMAFLNHPMPLCIVDIRDVVILANNGFKELFPGTKTMESTLQQLSGLKVSIAAGLGNKRLSIDNIIYDVRLNALRDGKALLVCFVDITEFEKLKHTHADEEKCVAHIQVDNYDALISSSPDDKKSIIAAGIERAIRQWAGSLEASIVRYYTSKYLIIFDHKHYEKIIANKFNILDEVRTIETDADFPVSLSIGVGVGGKSPAITDGYSTFALDLALGRGGDQAVVKDGPSVEYYGGTIQVIERRNKGKSRVVAHALKQVIEQSSKVIVMGHRYPDIDSFASAIGVARIVMNQGKEAYIVINEVAASMTDFYNNAVGKNEYTFIKSETALDKIDNNTLLIVVDTNRPVICEEPKLIGKIHKIVVFDHHRKTADPIENVILTFMEPSASSTSELITEVIQFISDKKSITRFEAELLLSGIIVDTNSFSVKTGMRTFEAAAWLRGRGADTAAVRQYLQNDMEDYKQRTEIIGRAEFMDVGIAVSRNYARTGDVHVINAQAADELLDIKGVKASFVIGATKTEAIISARSLGVFNVQKIMEKLGGGGHLTMAAAQLKNVSIDEAAVLLKETIASVL